MTAPRHAVAMIVLAEFFGTSLWFSVNAVAPSLATDWGYALHDLAHLTSAVQFGFIMGTLAFALSGLADRFPASRIFAVCALLGALANAAFTLAADQPVIALALRFVVGFSLAGVYPVGMKLVVSWAPEQAGKVLGLLVGMLTLGTGLPHLIRGLAITPDWRFVLYTASILATCAALMIWRLGNGPHLGHTHAFQWGGVLTSFRTLQFRAAAFGYFGHMWELYAFWTLLPLLISLVLGNHGEAVALASFAIFLGGAMGCMLGGLLSRRWGSARIARLALTGSATLCLIYPFMAHTISGVLLSLLFIWGVFVVADSPQFSALAAQACTPERVGSSLALMNCIGFSISIVSIELASAQWPQLGPQIAWLLLPGPLLGLLAMRKLAQ